ncbi:hypothetical protein [Solimonas marina]|uniref:Uncharacterized protein n=1 Tax=Solimonas marina TaxID=2714601 RepID=A0A969WDB1_9GAMM|nr:hypothetical protein [Solimonas marina]NKF23980.1 hypothetical protein [Solimonas marina]
MRCLAFIGLLLSACIAQAAPERHQHGGAQHHYVYYPGKQLYFAPERQMWFWRDGDDWASGGTLPLIYQQYTHGGYSVYLDVDKPYEAQAQVDTDYRHHRLQPFHYDGRADKSH